MKLIEILDEASNLRVNCFTLTRDEKSGQINVEEGIPRSALANELHSLEHSLTEGWFAMVADDDSRPLTRNGRLVVGDFSNCLHRTNTPGMLSAAITKIIRPRAGCFASLGPEVCTFWAPGREDQPHPFSTEFVIRSDGLGDGPPITKSFCLAEPWPDATVAVAEAHGRRFISVGSRGEIEERMAAVERVASALRKQEDFVVDTHPHSRLGRIGIRYAGGMFRPIDDAILENFGTAGSN